jgi:hypothetical protein
MPFADGSQPVRGLISFSDIRTICPDMTEPLCIEIIGFSSAECGPFPCEPDRSCGLTECFPSGSLLPAVDALRHAIAARYGNRIVVTVTLLDDGVPDRVKAIIERSHPPLPIVMVDGRVAPIGRISYTRIAAEIEKALAGSGDA